MKYYSESDLSKWFDPIELSQFVDEFNTDSINVRFCRDCPFFEPNGVQPDLPLRRGWCRRLSDEEPYGAKYPYYVHVTTNDFCNEDSIEDEVLQ